MRNNSKRPFIHAAFVSIALLAATAHAQQKPPVSIDSPDHKIAIEFVLQAAGTPVYKIDCQGKPVILSSTLGFPTFDRDFSIAQVITTLHDTSWTNPFGERRNVPDNFRQLDIDLRHATGKLLRITFRAYNEGVAFRYTFPQQDARTFTFEGELTEFRFPPETFAWEAHGSEGEFRRANVADVQPWCERPLTLELPGIYAALGEAANHRYPRMLLSAAPGAPGGLISALGGPTSNLLRGGTNDPRFTLAAGESTPWRFLILGAKPGDLLERNYLMLNLNPPSTIQDTSWIRPGKAMRDTALTTASAKAIIDLAPKLGLNYVGFDAHWYGTDDNGDASQIRVPNLNIKEVTAYAHERKIAVCLYIDARQARKQADTLFPQFKNDWGVDALKIGFVNVGSQADSAWITDILAKAAEHKFAVDIHDGYRATGNSRTFPNLLTVEGIRGNEHQPTPEHNCTLPFARYVGGIGDYTVCYLDRRKKTTHAHQLAMGVVSFSPMQWLYWYDRPAQLQQVPPEMEFWVRMPTVWDETRVIDGKIGEYAAIARRSGNDWFVGTINNSLPRTLRLPLSFLEAGKSYTAHLYSDDDQVLTATKVGVRTQVVSGGDVLEIPLKSAGGHAIWIEAQR